MKLLLVHNHYRHPGGEDIVFQAEKALLRGNGHDVVEYIEDNKRIGGIGAAVTAFQTLWSFSAKRRIDRVLRESRVDIAHFHNTFPLISPSAYYACRERGIPVIQTLHNFRMLCPGANFFRGSKVCEDCIGKFVPWPGMIHGCYRSSRSQTTIAAAMLTLHRVLGTWRTKVDAYIALSEFARERFISGGIPGEKIHVKPNFVHPDPGIGEGIGDYALYLGRLSAEKGLGTLLLAWGNLSGIPLKVAGDGPLLPQLKAHIMKHTPDSVELLGHRSREQVFTLIKHARFLVFPSECYENFPVSIVEAFACGVPVIASSIGSTAEIVHHEQTGLLFSPGDWEGLADNARQLWSRPGEAKRMGAEGRAEFEKKYTAHSNYNRLLEIYETII
jgi:glycosyltransferase involved in cell wall biosynthesis